VVKFSLASNKSRGEDKQTTWVEVQAWGKLGDIAAQYIRKGMKVVAIGEISMNEWTDKSGAKRTTMQLNATTFEWDKQEKQSQSPQAFPSQPGDDIPF
jgi:single-strand DNA-binding protein